MTDLELVAPLRNYPPSANPWGTTDAAVWDRVKAWGWTTHRMTAKVGEAVEIPKAKPRPCPDHLYDPPPFPDVCRRPGGCSYA